MLFRFYSKPHNSKGNVVVCVVATQNAGNDILNVAVARCSEKDQFVKKTGRELAEKRLNANELYCKYRVQNCKGKEFIKIAQQVAKEVTNTVVIYNDKPIIRQYLQNNGITEEELIDSENNAV